MTDTFDGVGGGCDVLVIYHANCHDGFCAAWVANDRLQQECCHIDLVPANYGDPVPDVTDKDVYILDFSYKKDVLLSMAEKANSIVLLDHHKTAYEDLQDVLDGTKLTTIVKDKLYIKIDQTHSGGRLTWDYFYNNRPRPWLVDYTEDRDLWKWTLPESKAINAALRSYPMDIKVWNELERRDLKDMIIEGKAILRSDQQIIDRHVVQAGTTSIAGHIVPCVNATTHISEIAGELAKGQPFAACYFWDKNGDKIFSLRSDENGMDVSAIARSLGGGGHKHAACYKEFFQF